LDYRSGNHVIGYRVDYFTGVYPEEIFQRYVFLKSESNTGRDASLTNSKPVKIYYFN